MARRLQLIRMAFPRDFFMEPVLEAKNFAGPRINRKLTPADKINLLREMFRIRRL